MDNHQGHFVMRWCTWRSAFVKFLCLFYRVFRQCLDDYK